MSYPRDPTATEMREFLHEQFGDELNVFDREEAIYSIRGTERPPLYRRGDAKRLRRVSMVAPYREGIQMRQAFLECETREEAEAEAPWACEIVEVEGGFMAFESAADYERWEAQV